MGKLFKKEIWHSKKSIIGWKRRSAGKKKRKKLEETKSIYSLGDQYTKERQQLHMEILNDIIKKNKNSMSKMEPTAILIGGGSGTGKTMLRENIVEKELVIKSIFAVTVDPDHIKEYIPEYDSLKNTHPTYAAALVHKESRDISDLLLKRLIKEQKDLIYESTLAKTHKCKKIIDKLHRYDYEVHVHVVDVPLKEAKKRTKKRAKHTGRTIPAHIIENTHKLVPRTFLAIKDSADSYHVYNNETKLKLIASNDYVHAKLYDEFLKKGGIK
ncbi:zeta toxin family protein [Virgibacillus necropolis]|uniref:zeta toxin family protein n=1 Tax=Virgibacillus necropolis TaxID=163877 RepID=UPI003850A99E